ncbi:hypothetical protein E1301_Tti024048 [Triplophysa tibetana]|uniref:Uncharacterized protein n=1 Tax=Triplophysa tibetana TaxID=1572043 RepID=A0A5A9P0D3_9TELE|nr:hypothetical protein E1301_Tti024048 [Triplophysa tibetana]
MAKMKRATRIALVTGDIRDCMSAAELRSPRERFHIFCPRAPWKRSPYIPAVRVEDKRGALVPGGDLMWNRLLHVNFVRWVCPIKPRVEGRPPSLNLIDV